MIHKMRLLKDPFQKIIQGSKTVEVRLLDNKRKLIKIGDKIEFLNRSEKDSKIDVKVMGLEKYGTFRELFERKGPLVFGLIENTSLDTFLAEYRKLYSLEKERKLGVIAITIEKLS